MQSCSIFIWPLGPCWVWFVRGSELLIQSFLFECQINFMNHKTCPDCSLMMSHYTLALCVNCWLRDKILALFTPPPSQDRYLFSFDMFILIIQFPSGFCSLLCHVGNQLTQLSHYPRTQHYTSYSLRRLFMMAVHEKQIKPQFFKGRRRSVCIFRSWTNDFSCVHVFTQHDLCKQSSPSHKWGRGQMVSSLHSLHLLVSDLRPWDPECSDTDSDIYKRHNISIHHHCHVSGSELGGDFQNFRKSPYYFRVVSVTSLTSLTS